MSRIILITGGCRSGKSDFAVALARQLGGKITFLATCIPCDDEMHKRVAEHRDQRPAEWALLEEGWDPAAALASVEEGTVLLDCVPTWIGNLLMRGDGVDAILPALERLGVALTACPARFALVVSAEVGDGLVPEYPLGRCFRDCAGKANQLLARRAEKVFLLTAGLARELKQESLTAEAVVRGLHELDGTDLCADSASR